MQSLEPGGSRWALILYYHLLRLMMNRLAQLQLMPLLEYLYVLAERGYVTVALPDLLLVLPHLMFEPLYLPRLMLNQSLLARAYALTPMQLPPQLLYGRLRPIKLRAALLQHLHLRLQLAHRHHQVIKLYRLYSPAATSIWLRGGTGVDDPLLRVGGGRRRPGVRVGEEAAVGGGGRSEQVEHRFLVVRVVRVVRQVLRVLEDLAVDAPCSRL